MDIKEAFKILELSENASDEEIKTKHKSLVFKYHPDRYKEDPNKLKQINEAVQTIQDYKEHPEKYRPQQSPFVSHNPFGGFGINMDDLFGRGFRRTKSSTSAEHIQAEINISFKESVLGTTKTIKVDKHLKCALCEGLGITREPNDCKNCNGFGQRVQRNGNMVFTMTCNCYGRGVKQNECKDCSGLGIQAKQTEMNIAVPAGIPSNTTLHLQGAGNYMGGAMFGDQYSDMFVHVNIEKAEGLELVGNDVVSKIDLSLLEALQGCEKQVKTIYGDKTISIPALSKNKEEMHLHGMGVTERDGIQRVILNVGYPQDVSKLIEVLK